MDAGLIVGGIGGASGNGGGRSHGVSVEGFAAAVHEGVIGVGVRVGAVGRRAGIRMVVAAWIARAVRVGHTRR